jgi:hypothetical protein
MLLDVIASSRRRVKSYRDEVLADNPVAYWRLGETSGTTAVDEVGNHNGTYQPNSSGVWTGGELGLPGAVAGNNSALFRPVNAGRVIVPFSEELNNSRLTAEAWARRTSSPGSFGYFIARDSSQRVFLIGINTLHTIYAVVWNSSGTLRELNTSVPIELNEWTHLALVHDGTNVIVYKNGLEVARGSLTGDTRTGNNGIQIGARNNNEYWPGEIDEVAFYATALSPTRIAAHYDARNNA